jgi:hypothetical protein
MIFVVVVLVVVDYEEKDLVVSVNLGISFVLILDLLF